MKKELLIPLLLLVCAFSARGQVQSNKIGKITISPGSSANRNLEASLGMTYHLSQNFSLLSGIQKSAENAARISLFPNPATEFITLQISDPSVKSYTIAVYNINGMLIEKMQSCSDRSYKLLIQNFAPGTYFVAIQSANNQIIKSLKFNKI